MQRHIENTLELTDVCKKIENWANDNDFDEINSTATKETFNTIFTKNYGKLLKFRWGICVSLFFIGAIFGAIYQSKSKIKQKNHSTNMEAFQKGFQQGFQMVDNLTNPSHPAKDLSTMLLTILFPGGYIAYYFYKKNRGMKFRVGINTVRTNDKTDIKIKSESDFQGIKTDIAKLYNALV